jgi:hypothetical protein
MTDRLSLANALADAKIERSAAERIATEIFDEIHESVATKADVAAVRTDLQRVEDSLRSELHLRLAELEHRLSVRFASVMVVLTGIVLAAIRYLPPAQ